MVGEEDSYQEYINFFEEVFTVMDNNYYKPVSKETYDHFVGQFNEKIYKQLKGTGKSEDFVRWRSASLLIERLKSNEDIFSEFYPPKPAKEYEQTALGVRIDLGIEGTLKERGYETIQVEPRADAYNKGLRIGDTIVKIDDVDVLSLSEDEIQGMLSPLEDAKVKISYLSASLETVEIIVEPMEYFKQMVFKMSINVPHVYGLQIKRFNRKTAEDMYRYIKHFKESGQMKGLILDLRDNPGGPPLAAREISSFFLTGGTDFAYFQKKNQPRATLDVPVVPEEFRYDGPMVILINEKSGSASELFSGILQRRKRAVLMGTNSAGQVMLKSMFHFDDESMMLLITARGHHPDGAVFSFGGLIPDRHVEQIESKDIIDYAIKYLYYVNTQKNG